ncbi:MAG TPA: recombinase family protein, partial [Chloroflexota bacterium]|nr:recombinase family protein [Chloroflexota bacterium]
MDTLGEGKGAMRVALYTRVSTHDQQTLPLQQDALREYALRRGWEVTREVSEIASGAAGVKRPKREELVQAAKR